MRKGVLVPVLVLVNMPLRVLVVLKVAFALQPLLALLNERVFSGSPSARLFSGAVTIFVGKVLEQRRRRRRSSTVGFYHNSSGSMRRVLTNHRIFFSLRLMRNRRGETAWQLGKRPEGEEKAFMHLYAQIFFTILATILEY